MFVGADTAWKLKRAVRLPFLDFTAAAERRRMLVREIELNQPGAPGLYRDVAAVIRRNGMLTLADGEPDDAVDWVLRMAPIPPGAILLDQVETGLDAALLDCLGDAVAADHAARPPHPTPGDVLHNIRNNARSAHQAGLPANAIAAWQHAAEAAADAAAPLLAERATAGLVRRAHGDLHLGNLCLWRGAPVPFDALEFSEAMATIDVGYDLAFLLMDLDRRAGRANANRVMNRYLARTGDWALLRLLPLFLSRRAMVRAHVTGELGYLDAALGYLSPPPGRVLAIGGLPGTGKSTLARRLAATFGPAPGAVIVRSDEVRKRLFGVAPEQRLPRDAYSAAANARVDAAMLDAVRAAGAHGVILDATFLNPALRAAVQAAAPDRFSGLWLTAPLDELRRRVAARSGDASDATGAVVDKMAALDAGPIDWQCGPAEAFSPK